MEYCFRQLKCIGEGGCSRREADALLINITKLFAGAIIVLTLYSLLPILSNTYMGIKQVDSTMKDIAKGLGMTPRQILFSVELPLSFPLIITGIKISLVWTIGMATLTSLIGSGGLGDLIMQGLRSMQIDLILAGTIPAAILAMFFDWLLSIIEKWLFMQNSSKKEIS